MDHHQIIMGTAYDFKNMYFPNSKYMLQPSIEFTKEYLIPLFEIFLQLDKGSFGQNFISYEIQPEINALVSNYWDRLDSEFSMGYAKMKKNNIIDLRRTLSVVEAEIRKLALSYKKRMQITASSALTICPEELKDMTMSYLYKQ